MELRNSKIKYKEKENKMGVKKETLMEGNVCSYVCACLCVCVCVCVCALFFVIRVDVGVVACPGVVESPRPYSLMCNEEGEIVL